LTVIPDKDNLREIDLRYSLLAPFADAHITWDEDQEELVYHVEEPTLSDAERETFDRIKNALEHKIDVSLEELDTQEKVLAYLEDRIDDVIAELGLEGVPGRQRGRPRLVADEDDPRVREEHIDAVEGMIDAYDDELDPLESFILPGGSDPGARLHHARAVCRRAERRGVAFAAEESGVNDTGVVYLNRLSDALFTLARVVNQREGVPEENPTY
jgi:cob(I)alamin adenosyltransferase